MTTVDKWTAEEEIISILRREDILACSRKTLASILNKEGKRIEGQLILLTFKDASSSHNPIEQSPESVFLSTLSELLSLDLKCLREYLDFYILLQVRCGTACPSFDYCSLELLCRVRDFILTRVVASWEIFSLLLQCNADADHIYHQEAKDYFTNLQTRKLFDDLIGYCIKSSNYSIRPPSITVFKRLFPQHLSNTEMLQSITADHCSLMVSTISTIVHNAIIACTFVQRPLSVVRPQLVLEFCATLRGATCFHQYRYASNENEINVRRIEFSLIVLLSALVFSDENAVNSASLLLLDSLASTVKDSELVPQSDFSCILNFVIGLGLSKDDKFRLQSSRLLQNSLECDAIGLLVRLTEDGAIDPKHGSAVALSRVGMLTEAFAIRQYEYLQDLVNCILNSFYVVDSVGSLEKIDDAVRLIQLSYRSDISLCEMFWSEWLKGRELGLSLPSRQVVVDKGSIDSFEYDHLFQKWHPLCRFICLLRDHSMHEPSYFFDILASLVCDSISVSEVFKLLSEDIPHRSWCKFAELHFLEESKIGTCVSYDCHGGLHVGGSSWSVNSGSTPAWSWKALTVPRRGSIGRISGIVSRGSDMCLVSWDYHTSIANIFMDALSSIARDEHSIETAFPLSSAAFNLLHVCIDIDCYRTVSFIENVWSKGVMQGLLYGLEVDPIEIMSSVCTTQLSFHDLVTNPEVYLPEIHQYLGGVVRDRLAQYHPVQHLTDLIASTMRLISKSVPLHDPQQARLSPFVAALSSFMDLCCSVLALPPIWSNAMLRSLADIPESIPVVGRVLLQFQSSPLIFQYIQSSLNFIRTMTITAAMRSYENGLLALFYSPDGAIAKSINSTRMEAEIVRRGYKISRHVLQELAFVLEPTTRSFCYESLRQFAIVDLDKSSQLFRFCEAQWIFRQLLTENIRYDAGRLLCWVNSSIHFVVDCLSWCEFDRVLVDFLTCSIGAMSLEVLNQALALPISSTRQTSTQIADVLSITTVKLILDSPMVLGTILDAATYYSNLALGNRYFSSVDAGVTSGSTLFHSGQHHTNPSLRRNAVLPVDYSRSFLVTPFCQLESVRQVSELSINLINKLIDESTAFEPNLVDPLIQMICLRRCSHFQSSRFTATSSFDQIRATSDPTYFSILACLVNIPSLTLSAASESADIQAIAIDCIRKVSLQFDALGVPSTHKRFTGQNTTHSWVDALGLENISGLCYSLCAVLNSAICSNIYKCAILDLLVVLARVHSVSFSLLLCVHQDSVKADGLNSKVSSPEMITLMHDASPKESAIVTSMIKLLHSCRELLLECPLLVHTLYELIIAMLENCCHAAIARCCVYLINDSNFWEMVTFPLFDDIVLPRDRSAIRSSKSMTNCHVMLVHSSALRLLTLERFGLLCDIHAETASTSCRKVDEFLTRATAAHRFSVWSKSYLYSSYDDESVVNIVAEAATAGIIVSTFTSPSTLYSIGSELVSRPAVKLGDTYIIDVMLIKLLVDSSRRNELVGFHSQTRVRELFENILLSLKYLNFRFSMCDIELQLMHSFGKFLEVFITPCRPRDGQALARSNTIDGVQSQTTRSSSADAKLCLSPASSANSSHASSPTLRSASEFSGDKRSYEVISRLRTDYLEFSVRTGLDHHLSIPMLRVVGERLRLLTNMLHHQLKDVEFRTSDPTRSRVQARDVLNPRLDVSHMTNLIKILLQIGRQIFPGKLEQSNGKDSEYEQYSRSTSIWLLSSFLLLMEGISAAERETNRLSDSDLDCREVLGFVFQLLEFDASAWLRIQLGSSNGSIKAADPKKLVGVELIPSVAAKNPLIIACLCAEIMPLCIPHSWSSLSTLQSKQWSALLMGDHLLDSLLTLYHKLSEKICEFSIPETDWTHVPISSIEIGHGYVSCDMLGTIGLDDRTPHNVNIAVVTVLCSISDMFLSKIFSRSAMQSVFTFQLQYLQAVSSSPLLVNYQRIIVDRVEKIGIGRIAALLGYSPVNGDESRLSRLWHLSIRSFSLVVHDAKGIEDQHLREAFTNCVSAFLQRFAPLLSLPFTKTISRMSFCQIRNMNTAVSFFVELSRHFPAWRSIMPPSAVHNITDGIAAYMGRLSCLMPVASRSILFGFLSSTKLKPQESDTSGNTVVSALQGYVVAVSNDEQECMRALVNSRKKMKLVESAYERVGSTDNYTQNRATVSTDDIECKHIQFFLKFERVIRELLCSSILFVTSFTVEFESVAEYEMRNGRTWVISPGLPIIFSTFDSAGESVLAEGVVHQDLQDGSVQVLLASTNYSRSIRISTDSVLFTRKPTFVFESYFEAIGSGDSTRLALATGQNRKSQTTEILNLRALDASSIGIDYSGEVLNQEIAARASYCSTAHLIRLLCYALSPDNFERCDTLLDEGEVDSLQTMAELCLFVLIPELKNNLYLSASAVDNLEFILRLLQSSKSAASKLVRDDRPHEKQQTFPFVLRTSWVEFADAIIEHLTKLGIVNKAAEIKKSPEKTPAKRGGKQMLAYIPNPVAKEPLM